ncbi:MAG: ATP-binding protein, partial [Psychrosphaera sp.]|nr:ATP-binding protein [Psychrosphaera sp.]
TATINTLLAQKERMFANISHEFKTPLTLILSPLESINDQTSRLDVSRKVSMMKRNGQRLLRMVEQLLELSRLETLDTGVRHNYSIKESLELLLTSFQPLLDVKNLTMDATELEDAIVALKADALEMILTNLISNAIKYTKDNGNITIKVQTLNNNVVLSVIDTGIGISPDNIQLVFKRFTRANEEHDESIPGAGIGLALVKELVENDKGTISLTSEIGKGSTFTVTFPVSTTQGETVQVIAGLSSTSQNEIDALIQNKELNNAPNKDQSAELNEAIVDNPDKPTLLLIDDNADMLTLLTDTLENRYQCITAKNGELGLEQAQSQIPDLIICDVMMPGISGYEVAKQLKLNELTCHIPVVLLTAKGDMDSRMEGWKQDIDDYLPKPFHPKELHLRIHSLLSIRHILKKRFNKEVAAADAAPAQVAQPIEAVMSDKDRQFIERFKKVIIDNFFEPEFSREQAAGFMMISDRQLHRKLSALIEDTFTEYLRSFRLEKAVEMLTTGLQIGQISDQVGFTSMAYFSKCFKAQFNKTPKQYQKELTH